MSSINSILDIIYTIANNEYIYIYAYIVEQQ